MAKTGAGRKLNRKGGFRTSLLRGLVTELIRHEQIKTTEAKAKECSRLANHLISVAKKDDLIARRTVAKDIHDTEVFDKIFTTLVPRYSSRPGAFTRIF